ncbi:MFS general substrate transporter [Aaosphaeria arxii CBS 175.79]|uniref:MFS general substrate transporter n=1 Tax=Aaosphaeria arxii CBS 175.79 TaxID=1450172 RepID=A0A6A5XNV1_9PLEO|nr:MFS general substrate transporter [Aaosphaeria arxii CBS 175.79]KAF2014410.1 MFS general substrate transporter [Aaosphaeria arxii CBS 175.79]
MEKSPSKDFITNATSADDTILRTSPEIDSRADSAEAKQRPENELPSQTAPKDPRIWLVFVALCLAAFCANLNATILTTVIPLITRDLSADHEYIWINAAFNIAAAAILPLLGQASNVLGRRIPMLLSLGLFTLGSALCGAAKNIAMMIACRAIQGAGAGGIMMLLEVITCDLFPLRVRGNYFAIVLAFCSIGVTLGPIVGGAFVKHTTWHWVFYVNVPFGGLAFTLAFLFLKFKRPKSTFKEKILQIDFVGNVLFMAGTISLLLGLIMGGQVHPWSSFRVIVPIVLGIIGWGFFFAWQVSPWCVEQTIPPRLFSNRTSAAGFVIIFLSCMLLDWVVYFLPYYFQTLKGSSPLRSGVEALPFNIFIVPAAGINGALLTKFGQYKPLHLAGFGMATLGFGLFSTMNTTTSTVKWVFWQLFGAYGLGALITTTLPAIQASLPESDVATSTALHAFLRSFGFIWAFTIPSVVFNNQVRAKLNDVVDDPNARAVLSNGQAYSQANSKWLNELTGQTKDQVLHLYELSISSMWYTAIAFSLLGFFIVFVEKRVKLRENLETDFGLEERNVDEQTEQGEVGTGKDEGGAEVKTSDQRD